MINKQILSQTTQKIIQVAALVGAVTVIFGAYSFYINNVWKPKVEVLSVDFIKGIAQVKIGKDLIDIFGDASFQVANAGDWGIKFGSTNGKYDSLELTKKGLVVEYLKR